jgi:3-dehydrosphinganine reductase
LVRKARTTKRSFAGKHVLVTGGSQGLGKALASQLLARGAKVTILARTEATLATAEHELRAEHQARNTTTESVPIQHVAASITDSASLEGAVARASAAFGPIDTLVCCAGAAAPGLFLHTGLDTFSRSMETNYMGTVRSIKAVVDGMVARRDGHIILIGSAMSAVGFMGYSTYAPTKHALRGLADTLRNELIGFNIAVQIAYPPDTDTPGFAEENKTKPIETLKMVRARLRRWRGRHAPRRRGAVAPRRHRPPVSPCARSRRCQSTSSQPSASRPRCSRLPRVARTTSHRPMWCSTS